MAVFVSTEFILCIFIFLAQSPLLLCRASMDTHMTNPVFHLHKEVPLSWYLFQWLPSNEPACGAASEAVCLGVGGLSSE
jgi:hypothetical protein